MKNKQQREEGEKKNTQKYSYESISILKMYEIHIM